ncbi:hypothetical protein AJ87_30305 [Rhizobium yanglingense]|nr:hypothetical protein AJ87_30305 [Rhizobium yanglingense]
MCGTGLPACLVRKEAKYGTCRESEGQDVAGSRLTFIEDVITTGGAVPDAYRMAAEERAQVLAVVLPGEVVVPEPPFSASTHADLENAQCGVASRAL